MLTGQTFQNAIVFSFKKSFHVNECTVNFLSGTNKGLKKLPVREFEIVGYI